MAVVSTQFSATPVEIWVNYDTGTNRVQSVSYRNPQPVAVPVEVQRNNGQWTTIPLPALTPPPAEPLATVAVNGAQYTITIVNGQVDVAPNIRTF